ncbi:MAG: hypothetical protein RL173_3060 [Fibrobacterota bacterium]
MLAAAVGGCLGSFFNVVVWRVPRGLSVVHPGSRCPSCGKEIPFYRNLPVVTWILQRGKCAWCSWPIPRFYVLVEAFCALLGAGWAYAYTQGHWTNSGQAVAWAVFAFLAVPISLIDWEHFEIPDGLVVTAGFGGLWAVVGLADPELRLDRLVGALKDGLLSAGFLYAIHFGARVALGAMGDLVRAILPRGVRWSWRRGLRKDWLMLALRWGRFDSDMEALGLGDVSLALAAGVCLGFQSVWLGLAPAAAFGALGFLYRKSRPLHATRAAELGIDPQAIPFGPFLCAGFLVVAWMGAQGFSIP